MKSKVSSISIASPMPEGMEEEEAAKASANVSNFLTALPELNRAEAQARAWTRTAATAAVVSNFCRAGDEVKNDAQAISRDQYYKTFWL